MGINKSEIKENIKVVEALERPSLIKFGILILFFMSMTKPYFLQFKILEALW